ncbi:hypothetical protein [Bradyrhizobium sp. MOS002]|uniref:hypothetical protein n=1 Tax=Bradyrhizobium sp. MOS002 TaxID=2133947 RepID=UPI0011B28109|nr:hypothetical protein [Bradyrhizobium sp. MOS002]
MTVWLTKKNAETPPLKLLVWLAAVGEAVVVDGWAAGFFEPARWAKLSNREENSFAISPIELPATDCDKPVALVTDGTIEFMLTVMDTLLSVRTKVRHSKVRARDQCAVVFDLFLLKAGCDQAKLALVHRRRAAFAGLRSCVA